MKRKIFGRYILGHSKSFLFFLTVNPEPLDCGRTYFNCCMDEYYTQTKPRIVEYCGGDSGSGSDWDSEFVVCGLDQDRRFCFMGNSELDAILDMGADVYRSLWSRQGSLFFLDLEYINKRDAEDIYRNGRHIFKTHLEPVYQQLCGFLEACNLRFLTVMTATGYHFVFAVPFALPAHKRLERLGSPCHELLEQYARVYARGHRQRPVSAACANAFDGLGRLAEFLAKRLNTRQEVPVEAGLLHPRQIVLDLSTYADPLHLRFLRCVGSYHQKSSRRRYATCIRRQPQGQNLFLRELLRLYDSPNKAADMISSTPATIPEAGEGLHELLTLYEQSKLCRRHRDFDAYQPAADELRTAKRLLQDASDQELAADSGLKRAVLEGHRQEIHPAAIGKAVGECLEQGHWTSPIMAWANEQEDGYNPYSRAMFWARIYGT